MLYFDFRTSEKMETIFGKEVGIHRSMLSLLLEMEDIINKKYVDYDLQVDFEELPININDVNFLMQCKYNYDSYLRKLAEEHNLVNLE